MPHQDFSVDGVVYPSVTEILGDAPKPWLEAWKAKWGILADRKTKASTNVGTAFHDAAERLVKGEDVNVIGMTRRLTGMLEVFEEWRTMAGLVIKETELHVVSHEHKYQGTFDATGYLADTPDVLCLFDWKTSSGIYPDMALQLAAYGLAYNEQTGIEITRGLIVHVSKDKPKHKLTVKEYKIDGILVGKFLKRLQDYREARG